MNERADQTTPQPAMPRRLLLSLGGMLLLTACADPSATGAPAPPPPPLAAAPDARHPPPQPSPPQPSPPQPFAVRTQLPAAQKAVALTIDDGPDPRWTQEILAVLRRHAIKATFCMIGRNVQARPDIARAVAADGHEIANHTWSHADLARLPAHQIHAQLESTTEAIARATPGTAPTLFRAPFGAWSPTVIQVCHELNMRPLGWSVDTRDWSRPGMSHIVDTLLHDTKTGSIILSHDGGGDRSQTVAALRTCLPRLLDAGYHFVTVASE
jgi:peptidoglycan/xylan/chitin deacetylase (PgdA/CDA1 family)